MGMNWLYINHVHINCFSKTVLFPKSEESRDSRFITSKQAEISFKQDARVLKMLASLNLESEVSIANLPIA